MTAIGVDATFLRPGRTGGAQQMLENLLDGLAGAADPGDSFVVFGAPTRPVEDAAGRVRWAEPPRGKNRFGQSWRILRSRARGLDALLFPNYFTPPRRGGRSPRIVTVIHDLHFRAYPESFSPQKRVFQRLAHETTLRVADVVVAPSEHVRRDILASYGSRWEPKVAAIPNPVSWRRFEGTEVGPKDLADRRYVLSVSAQYAHKNLTTLLRAFAHLRGRTDPKDVTLVLAGQWSDRLIGIARRVDLREEVRRLGLEDTVRMTGYVSDAEIGALYRGASAFVFPSLYEGFGLPVVEALGFGLPVLTTRRTAIPESTLGLATYLDDPLDPVAMADALASILASPERFRPRPADVAQVRETYAPARIGRLYLDALRGA